MANGAAQGATATAARNRANLTAADIIRLSLPEGTWWRASISADVHRCGSRVGGVTVALRGNVASHDETATADLDSQAC